MVFIENPRFRSIPSFSLAVASEYLKTLADRCTHFEKDGSVTGGCAIAAPIGVAGKSAVRHLHDSRGHTDGPSLP